MANFPKFSFAQGKKWKIYNNNKNKDYSNNNNNNDNINIVSKVATGD